MTTGFGFNVTVIGMDILVAKLKDLPPKAIEYGLEDAAKYTLTEMQTYPAYRHVPMEWVSEKQRRYVMAAIAEGKIKVPYDRTMNLQQSWRSTISGYTAMIAADTLYAHWVQGEDQARQMSARGWTTTKEFVSRAAGQIASMFDAGVKRAIAAVGL